MPVNSSAVETVPASQADLSHFMAQNFAGPRKTICPVGGQTALYHMVDAQTIVSTTGLNRLVDYPARDMTITVEAGMRVSDLQSTLAVERQRLPIDLSQPQQATIGGALATNASGPRRFGHGTFRDYVIGISAVDAAGNLFKAGGRVVKNVAGYDVCKLLVGSRGTLGIVSQVTLKLRPLADLTSLMWCVYPSLDQIEDTLGRLLMSHARPVAIDVLNSAAAKRVSTAAELSTIGQANILCLGVEGTRHEVDWQVDTLKREIGNCGVQSIDCLDGADSARLWDALTDFSTRTEAPLTFQANLLPSKSIEFAKRATDLGVAVQLHAGNGVMIGQLPAEAVTADRGTAILIELRRLAVSHHGNLIVTRCPSDWTTQVDFYGDPGSEWELMTRLKRQLDPARLLNPGHFIDVSSTGRFVPV